MAVRNGRLFFRFFRGHDINLLFFVSYDHICIMYQTYSFSDQLLDRTGNVPFKSDYSGRNSHVAISKRSRRAVD